jgi:CUB domain
LVIFSACGGIYSESIHGEFGSPHYPESSPLNTYCVWQIKASVGNKVSLTIKNIDIAE